MQIYNSLTRQKEEFKPLDYTVRVYACGPTVYDFVHIGNWRTYTLADILIRTLRYFGYETEWVMNITDVGHLSGDGDTGEDKLVKAAQKERKTAGEIAQEYTANFLVSYDKLNLVKPKVFAKATEHIEEQIELIKKIEAKGLTYRTSDGLYFDTPAYEAAGGKYGELSTLDEIRAGARVEINPEKKDPRDFALWKFSPSASSGQARRDMEWDSPWGKGFPGWHIECSAMSMKYLGEQFDLHLGGEDLRPVHHPNEIAQAEAATGKKPFVKYWVHGAFLLVDGQKMGKSLENTFRIEDIEAKGLEALDLRYFYLTAHYRKQQNFTWEGLKGARKARLKLAGLMESYREAKERTDLKPEKLEKLVELRDKFRVVLADDLNLPEALAVAWQVVKSNIADYDKFDLLREFDQVLGLKLVGEKMELPEEIKQLAAKREALRQEGKWEEADRIRKEIEAKGFRVEDQEAGVRIRRR